MRRVVGGIVGVRVRADPGQLASRRTSHDGEFGRAEGTESGVGEGRDPVGLLCRTLGPAARTRSGRHDSSAIAIPTRIASDIARLGSADGRGVGRGSHGTDIEGRPGARHRSPTDRSGFARAGTRPVASSQRLGPWGVRCGDPLLERVQLFGAPLGSMTLPPAFVHSSAPLMLTNPLPLQRLPLHEFFGALAQAPGPCRR